MITYPRSIEKLNERLSSELGHNPRYAWRWSGDLLHVMVLVDEDGKPKYVQQANEDGLIVMTVDTETRLLLPNHPANWVVCALVDVNERDGSIQGTGTYSWVPVSSSNSGPVALPEGQEPDFGMTICLIESIRMDRNRRIKDRIGDWDEDRRKREKQHWIRIYEQIADSSAAFYSVPGKKGSVSFPSVERVN